MARAAKHPITPEHRAKFAGYLQAWARRLNLDDWRIEFMDRPASRDTMAEVQLSYEDRLAVFYLGRAWRLEPTDRELERTAVHELLHVRVADIIHFSKGQDETAQGAAEHALIVLLEKLLIPA